MEMNSAVQTVKFNRMRHIRYPNYEMKMTKNTKNNRMFVSLTAFPPFNDLGGKGNLKTF